MMMLSTAVRVYIAAEPIDMRKSIDSPGGWTGILVDYQKACDNAHDRRVASSR